MALHRRDFLKLGRAGGIAFSLRSASAVAESPDVLNIANAAGMINLTMQQLMADQKYLEAFDLSVKVLDIADGSKIVAGILGGGIELSTMAGFGQIFPAIERGASLKVLAGAALIPSLAVYSAKKDVVTVHDLAGRTIGVGALGSLLHQLMVALLIKNKIDLQSVRFVNVGSSADVFRAVTAGVVDAGTGEAAILDEVEKYHVHAVIGGNMSVELPNYTYQGAWTSQKMIDTKRDAIVRALAAYAKLYRFVQTADAHDAFLKAYAVASSNGSEGGAIWNYVQKYRPFAENLVLNAERLNYIQQLNVDLKVQAAVLPFERVADMSLATEAVKLLA